MPHGSRRSAIIALMVLTASLLTLALPTRTASAADPACTVNTLLVNSCRPWFGGSANGYPETGTDIQSQMLYFEQRTGRQMDIARTFHGTGAGSHVLSSVDLYFARRPDTILMVDWPLTNTFAAATGGDATVNGYIDQMAASVASLGDTKIMLSLHHEPENDIPATCPGQTTTPGTMGTAADYVAMWHNVRARFDALGVRNVVWVMDYINYAAYDCMIADLWPGNDYVDYVAYNGYQSSDTDVSFAKRVGRFYDFLLANSTPEHDYASKEWGIVEWSIYNSTQANAYRYYQQAGQAVEDKVFPKLRFYLVFDNYDRTKSAYDYQVAYDRNRVYDPLEQAEFNLFANSWALTGDGAPPRDTSAPSVPGTAAVTVSSGRPVVSWEAATDDVGVTAYDVLRDGTVIGSTADLSYTDVSAAVGVSYSYTVQARDAAGNGSAPSTPVSTTVPDTSGPTTPDSVTVTVTGGRPVVTWAAATDDLGVTAYEIMRDGSPIGSTAGLVLTDTTATVGTHSYTVLARDAAGNTSTTSAPVSVTVPDTTAPTTPGNVAVTVSGGRPVLTWAAAADDVGVTAYDVLRNGTVVTTTTALTFTDSTASSGAYGYTVRARDAAGNASEPSAPANATVGDTSAPTIPGRVAVATASGRPVVTWAAATDNVRVTAYVVLRNGTVVGSTATRTWTDTTAAQGVAYSYTVRARDAAGNSSAASTAVTVSLRDTTAPGTAGSLTASRSGSRATLTWGAATDNVAVTNYLLYRGSTLIATVSATTRSATATGLASGTTYTWSVRARDAAGNLGAARTARG